MTKLLGLFVAVLFVGTLASSIGFAQSPLGADDEIQNRVRQILATSSNEERGDRMVEFVHWARELDRAVLERPTVVEALARLLDDGIAVVQAAYLLGEIGPPAASALPALKAALKAHTHPPVSDLGFEFNRDKKPAGALEYAIVRIEQRRE